MSVNTLVIQGESVLHTSPPAPAQSKGCVSIPGVFRRQHYNLQISEEMLSKHVLLIGGTGCGKTNAFYYFVSQLKQRMTPNDVMLIFDTKGDFAQKFYRPGDVLIGNSKVYANISERWNIYKEIVVDGWDESDIYNNTHEITRSFFKEATEKTTQPFFPNAARDLLSSILLAQLRLGKEDIGFRKKFFNNKALKRYLDIMTPQGVNKFLSKKPFADLASVLSYIGDGASEQSLGVFGELQSVVRQLFVGKFAEDGRFSVRNFVREKGAKTLFIEYDLSIGDTLTPMYRLLFDLALKEALGRNKTDGNVYFICDEFKLLPNLQHIEDGVNFGRSLGVKVLAGLQSIEQLYEIYGESRGKNIAAGFSSIFAFRANDTTTRDFVSDLHGKNIVLEQYKTSNNTMVEEKREGKTVEDWDLTNLSVGEAIVGLPFEKPFRFQMDRF